MSDGEGWTIVYHRRNRYNESDISKDKKMNDKFQSFFFTIFPENFDTKALWKIFKRWGKVGDVFIAAKRDKWGGGIWLCDNGWYY